MKHSLRKTPSHLHLAYKYGEPGGGLLGRNLSLDVEGDTHFPAVSPADWREVGREIHPRGERDTASFTLRILDRRQAHAPAT